METATPINWHRVFGLTLTDFFTGSNFLVDLEKELTVKKQFLDVVLWITYYQFPTLNSTLSVRAIHTI